MALNFEKLGSIFQSRPDIINGIKSAADSSQRVLLFNQIADHVYDQLNGVGEPAHKKRRVEIERTNGAQSGAASNSNAADEEVLLVVKEISVSVPQRKKFELCFTANHFYARAPGTTAPIPAITYAWHDLEYAFYLPVPEKTQVQHNYVLFPKGTSLPSKTNPPTAEPIVFTIPATSPKEGTIGGAEASEAAAVSDAYKDLFHWAIGKRLKSAGNPIPIISANPNKFHSKIRQGHRPNERAVHVNGFRGSKDGFLFFLENGILWGYKKPLLFIPLNRIAAISYTNILQITFNMVVEVFPADGDESANEELEFGMLDQQDYGGIDDYVKDNRLQDRSMAEQRKGKLQLAENKAAKKGAEDGGADGAANGDDGLTELERAQKDLEQQAQDEEDEDEEDYDPGSDDDTDGCGSSSEDDDDDDAEGGEDGDEDDDEDGEGGEGEEEEGKEEEEAAEEDQVMQEPAVKVEEPKAAAPAPAPAPVARPAQRGWATVSKPQPPPGDVDMDEHFEL
ncbi:histone chaperone [Sarocladium implicatum]|nr:histone chaperone [Sarocladium implicatum]